MSTQVFFTPGVVPLTNFNRNLGDLKMHTGPPSAIGLKGVLFVLKGPYDTRVSPIVKFSQESESALLTNIILSKSTVKTL